MKDEIFSIAGGVVVATVIGVGTVSFNTAKWIYDSVSSNNKYIQVHDEEFKKIEQKLENLESIEKAELIVIGELKGQVDLLVNRIPPQ